MGGVEGYQFPEDRFYDVANQIWYAPLPDGTLRAGYTAWAAAQMGDLLVFTPKRTGQDFEKDRWFAMVEGGKWVGAARAGFAGTVVAHNADLVVRPALLNRDPFGAGWMLVVRPADAGWRDALVTGAAVAPAVAAWIASEAYEG